MPDQQTPPPEPTSQADDAASRTRPAPPALSAPRSYVTRLFAAALEHDPIAAEELRELAPWDPTAAAAFEAVAVADYFRDTTPQHPGSVTSCARTKQNGEDG
jgi:hypothetical protein